MKSLLKYFFAISLLVLSGCSQNASTPFTTNSTLNSSNAIFDGDVNDPDSIAFFKKNVGDRVLFAVDQSDLDQLGKNILLGQVEWLQANKDYKIIIEGHADERGTREYNLALGERRANAAKDYLMTYGVSSDRITVISYGKERPVDSGSTPLAWSKNRRSVTVKAN